MAARGTEIHLTAEQRRRLAERSKRQHRTFAELVREAIDAYLSDQSRDADSALEATFGALPGLRVQDRADWDRS